MGNVDRLLSGRPGSVSRLLRACELIRCPFHSGR
jgi:hypothetical protein